MSTKRKCILTCITSAMLTCILMYLRTNDSAQSFDSALHQQAMSELKPSPNRTPTILMWTTVFGEQRGTLVDCPLKNQCQVTFDKAMFPEADAVVFHPPVGLALTERAVAN